MPRDQVNVDGPEDRDGEEVFRIVGIGASAGGLESLEQFFAAMPAEPGAAFVVIQHLSPDFRSMMSELLSRHSRMPVQVVTDGTEVQPNHIYLLPPRKEMTIEGGRLLLADKDPGHALTLPIDLFFRSLARDAGARATGIVLSGSGSDGSRGIREIKRAGGMVLVESAESAKFDGMPLSAQATGLVDCTAPPAELARYVLEGGAGESGPGTPEASVDESPMDSVLRLLRTQYGLDFTYYKKGTVSRRILRRVALKDAPSLEDYVDDLHSDADELNALYHDLLIGVTRFFRDPEAFDILEGQVVPEIVEAVRDEDEIRIWVAGCATGEEAYSLAIVFMEQFAAVGRPFNFKVLATDVHRASLDHASIGMYAEEQLENVSEQRRERFFVKRTGGYQVSQDLRQRIVFAPHNVVEDAPFTKMHLITCRNLLIYLEPEAQRTVLSLFHFGLAKNGVLFLGSSEATGPFANEFDAIDEHWKIYRKRRDVRLVDPLRVPVARRTLGLSAQLLAPPRRSTDGSHLLPLYDQLLDDYMPPGLLVDETRTLVDSFGGAERYLRLGRRRPSTNVLDLLEGDLRTIVAGALQRVLSNEPRVRYTGIPLQVEGSTRRITLTVRSLASQRAGGRHVLITFEHELPRASAVPSGESAPSDEPLGAEDRLRVLESELAYTRETLQSSVEEQQTSNEELQATNEELVASNEELQSTNEELHSVNEELYTVNGEYQKKIIELREVNNDMQHLLEGADNGTLFLDRELRIRKFTPRIASVFHLRPGDVGRPIRDFSHDLDRATLLDEIEGALKGGVSVEDEVRDRHGTTFFLRILPYRPAEVSGEEDDTDVRSKPDPATEPEGVMLTVTDISVLERARARIEQLSAIVESSDDAILSKDLDGVITSWNGGAERLYGYRADEVIGRKVHMLAPPDYRSQIDGFLETLKRGERVEHVETMRMRKDGETLDVSITISPIRDEGKVVGASAIARDVTQLRQAQRDLEQREARIRLLLDSTAEAVFGLDLNGVCTFSNPACARMLGYASPNDLIGKRIHPLMHHSHADGSPYPEDDCPIYSVLRTGRGAHADDEVLYRSDGSSFPAEYWSHPTLHEGRLDGAVVTFLDITDRRKGEEEIRLAARRREHFLAMLSHELRNPLAAVLNASALLKAVAPDTPALMRACGVIDRQGRHMARLLDDLLDVSRITRGGIELRKENLDLRTILRLAVEAVTPHLDARRIRLEMMLPEMPLPVHGDAARLQQIAGNLLTNAAKYSPEGSLVIVSARAEGDRAIFSVKDEGDGISAELLPQIFDLFVQNDQGLARSNGGLGVGLALVRQLTELHNGRVEAASEGPGKGSEFRVILPLLQGRVSRDDQEKEPTGARARRVVVVEDQDDSRVMLRDVLEAMGYDVYEARDGREAVDVVQRVHPDVALIDIGLPIFDGFEVARRIRDNPGLNDVVLVALTGYGAAEDVRAAQDAGFTAHVTKPADPRRIDEVLHGGT